MRKSRWGIKDKTCGVYKITNKITGDFYIGATTNIQRRWNSYLYSCKNKKSTEYNTVLCTNIREYGLENFSFEILELNSSDLVFERERYYIKLYNPKYNTTPGGKGGHNKRPENFEEIIYDLKYKKITLKKIALKYGYCFDTITKINQGKIWYDETLDYPIRKFALSEIIDAIYYNPIIQLDKNGKFLSKWNSGPDFAKKNNYKSIDSVSKHIYQVCRGERKTAYGFLWKFEKDYTKNIG